MRSCSIQRVHRIIQIQKCYCLYRSHSSTGKHLLDVLDGQIVNNILRKDDAQYKAARRLHRLQGALTNYCNENIVESYRQKQKETRELLAAKQTSDEDMMNYQKNEKVDRVHNTISESTENIPGDEIDQESWKPTRIPRGVYLHGAVGSGKTMLMDLFFEFVSVEKKQRWHFHAFLGMVHSRIHNLKREDLAIHGRNFHVDTSLERNPIHRVGLELASELSLLCLDEFQVTDVADAVILSQLFSTLWQLGTVVVATSNRPPSELYRGGLNRSYFMPFIELLERHSIVHNLSSMDYRKVLTKDLEDFFFGLDDTDRLDELVSAIREGALVTATELSSGYSSRTWKIEDADDKGLVARLSFEEVCGENLGASDYRALAGHFSAIIMDNVPIMTLKTHDSARRFVLFVDELYEAKTAFACSSVATDPSDLFINSWENTAVDEDIGLGIDQATSNGHAVGALASVQELGFAFQRAESRLREMTSPKWWNRVLRSN